MTAALPRWSAITFLLFPALAALSFTRFPTQRRLRAEERRGGPDVVHEMASWLRRLIARDVAIELDVQPGTAVSWVDREQLKQVVLNLVVNARDAMPDGGTIRVDVAEVGVMAQFRVTDTGIGMDRGDAPAGRRALLHHEAARSRHPTRLGHRGRHPLEGRRSD